MELELLSKLCTNTSMILDASLDSDYNVGICQRHGEYMLSLPPFQHATFNIQYIADYIDTYKYLGWYISAFPYPLYDHLMVAIVTDHLKVDSKGSPGAIYFYISSSGRLNTMLSEIGGIQKGLQIVYLKVTLN
ncbi:hypothetical protein BDQ17DRAFT_1333534 [Cyathus striatus]|nr:hypothetical protein BDQ17DRAFT_1333534 [Cyathus striatus]